MNVLSNLKDRAGGCTHDGESGSPLRGPDPQGDVSGHF